MLSTFDDEDYICRAMQYGASGYLLKDTNAQELIQSIRMVVQGYTQSGPGLFEKSMALRAPKVSPLSSPSLPATAVLPPELASLTKREREVLCHVITGASNPDSLHRRSRQLRPFSR